MSRSFVNYIHSDSGIKWDFDYVLPFAAISENGNEIDGIDPKSELAHHLMLTNVLRLLGSIKKAKAVQRIQRSRPSQVILPLSLNHSMFGSDGLANKHKIVTALVESEGAGAQVITSAKLAPERFPPIWRIVALTATASDKTGRSVPAPGPGTPYRCPFSTLNTSPHVTSSHLIIN